MPKRKANDPLRGLYQRNGIWWLSSGRKGARIKPISLETRDVTEALARATRVRNDPVLHPAGQLWGDAVDYIKDMRDSNRWKPTSIESKSATIRQFCEAMGQKPADKVTLEDVKAWYIGLRTSYTDHNGQKRPARAITTRNSYVSVIRSFFAWLIENKRARENPAKKLKRDEQRKGGRCHYCTTEERDMLIDKCQDKELKLLLFLGFHAGLRKGEIVEAVPSWIDLRHGVMHLHKTPTCEFKDDEERSVPLTDEFQVFLRSYKKLPSPFLIKPKKPAKKGRMLLRYDPEKRFKAYVKSQGLQNVMSKPLTMHIMRHTFASCSLQAGQSLSKIAKWIGDCERVTSDNYAHLMPSDASINLGFRKVGSS